MSVGPPLHEPAEPDPPSEGTVLWASAALIFPEMEDEDNRRTRAEKLEDYIERSARMRGRLAGLRLRANVDLKIAQDEWDSLVVSTPGKVTLAQAKRTARPELAQKIKDSKWTIERCSEEMERLDRDYDSASRAYTILSGS